MYFFMSSLRETFILKLVKFDDSEQRRVSLTLRNIKSEEAVNFSSTEELAEYLDTSEASAQQITQL
jgi:hypothetical protein